MIVSLLIVLVSEILSLTRNHIVRCFRHDIGSQSTIEGIVDFLFIITKTFSHIFLLMISNFTHIHSTDSRCTLLTIL